MQFELALALFGPFPLKILLSIDLTPYHLLPFSQVYNGATRLGLATDLASEQNAFRMSAHTLTAKVKYG